MIVYRGWIKAINEKERKVLESLGIVVGEWDENCCMFDNCRVDNKALEELKKCWGQFIWGLTIEN